MPLPAVIGLVADLFFTDGGKLTRGVFNVDFPFRLRRVYFEPAALEYPRGEEIYHQCKDRGIPVIITPSHNRVHGIPGESAPEAFAEAKQTLVVGVRRPGPFQTCRPSAHYQLPLATGCPGRCRYCYLHTT